VVEIADVSGGCGQVSELSAERVREWWTRTSPAIARLTAWMDSREAWVSEPDDEFIALLDQIVSRIEEPEFVMAIERGLANEVAQLFAILCSSRFLRVMDMFERRVQGISSRLVYILGRLGGDAKLYSDLFCERLMLVHRLELLGEIFSPRRCETIACAVRNIKGGAV